MAGNHPLLALTQPKACHDVPALLVPQGRKFLINQRAQPFDAAVAVVTLPIDEEIRRRAGKCFAALFVLAFAIDSRRL